MLRCYEEDLKIISMLAVIISDAHGRIECIRKVYNKHLNADLYIDAGDSERAAFELNPFITVRGNCDLLIDERHRIINFGPHRIYVFHGDNANLSPLALYQRAADCQCNIIIHGHTHVPRYIEYKGIYIICPGSIAFPRNNTKATYALLKGKKEISVEFIQVDCEEY